jgi:integrase
MGRVSKKLSALEVGRLSKPGKHPIGESLYLQISPKGTKSWLFRYSINGKSTWMGLGSAKLVSLADARALAIDHQRDLLDGVKPLDKRNSDRSNLLLEDAKRITFDDCAEKYIEAHSPSWKNKKHASQWKNTMETYASPVIGKLSVKDIETTLILKILEPIWYTKAETAARIRGRIERILSWAAVRGYRSKENPARWHGHLEQLLPTRSSIQKVKHFKALPFSEVGAFVEKLRSQEGVTTLALEFTILTATRTNEALGARWSEINLEEKYWLIPAERMKADREHKVPLSPRALDIIAKMRELSDGEYVFSGTRRGQPLSDMSLLMIIRRMGLDATTHGFRSSFSDWAAERTSFPREVVEMALAHTVKNKVEAAYRRGDLFIKRQRLMEAWAKYCTTSQNLEAKVLVLTPQLSRQHQN